MSADRIVSGMRPTGRLHLGHLEGVIRNWIALQDRHECFFFVADVHALTDRIERAEISRWSFEMVRDWLALGIDPAKATVFVQSHVHHHVELAALLGMVAPVTWLERCPTYKDRVAELGSGSENLGLLSYPVLMAADVALYGADKIPVGEDQVTHLELAREVIRKFNARFEGANLVEPQPFLTKASKLMGTDGRKMSKSYGNTIELAAAADDSRKKIMTMKTDEARLRRSDPGNPDHCNLFPYHLIYTDDGKIPEIRSGCTSAALGCVDCKKILNESVDRALAGYRARREKISDEDVRAVMKDGAARASAAAAETMRRVIAAVGMVQP